MNELQQGLLIAAIGMGLVFAVIIFLWGLMALMMRLTSRQDSVENAPAEVDDTAAHIMSELKEVEDQRGTAAAAAVAVGLAITATQGSKLGGDGRESTGGPSAWQSFHRTRQLESRTK